MVEVGGDGRGWEGEKDEGWEEDWREGERGEVYHVFRLRCMEVDEVGRERGI